ncbi:DUF2630 family protein [Streptacidiphilus monticola]|uniref:DUF2630 family protein n=1 Tax=Streptacidiphilus monticola TaxID=2161674 RepID=A0ABW1G3S1_9ACTN
MTDDTDKDVLTRIKALVDEEHQLRSGGSGDDAGRLASLEAQLDQCWDLLRQRRAAKEFGNDPGAAHARPISEVEGYQQ